MELHILKKGNPELYDMIDGAMQVVMAGNDKVFKDAGRDDDMCQAMLDLMKDKIDAIEAKAEERGMERGLEQLIQAVKYLREGKSDKYILSKQINQNILDKAKILL